MGCQAEQTQPTTGPAASSLTYSEIPLTAAEEADIRGQIERNWNVGSLAGSPHLVDSVIELRVQLLPDGTVTGIEAMNEKPGNPDFRQAVDSAIRAVMISSPLKLPAGKRFEFIRVRFMPGEILQ
jgi:hypothetical protein